VATREQVLTAINNLSVWRRADERAPHKPLLLLLALARLQQGGDRLIPFVEIDDPLARLLRQFGPPRRTVHPEYPFWWLRSDGLWDVISAAPLTPRTGSTDPPRGELIDKGARGGFPEPVWQLLKSSPQLVDTIIRTVLDAHFPASIHEDIQNYVGLALLSEAAGSGTARSPRFAEEVIRAYGRCCAVCGYDVKIGSSEVGLEAAHIKWRQAGGPDDVANGLALCAVHHKALDRGAIGISVDREILVSCDIHGQSVAFWFEPFRRLATPSRSEWLPRSVFIEWHLNEVFRAAKDRA
jgi:putative restriction endonuclease